MLVLNVKWAVGTKIGIEGNFDNELIMGINPDVIFISPFKRGGYDAMREVGIPLIPHLGYKETSPLGSSGVGEVHRSVYRTRDQSQQAFLGYRETIQRTEATSVECKKRPVVFSGELRGGNWYALPL